MGFTRATVKPFYLRLAIDGPAGSVKTFTSLEVATFIAQQYGDLPPAFIDTERGSASKYASRFAFDVIDMDKPFHPDRFVKGIQMAVDAGYKVLVIDSLSHAWNGPGGLLELVDNFAKKYGGNGFAGWKDATPIQTRLIDAIIGANLHIIACMRAKMDYAQDKDERGRTQITKVGLAPIQREGMEYEFDVVGDMTVAHALSISKTRCAELTDQLFVKPGRDFARILWNWTQSGVTREQFAAQAATATPVAIQTPASKQAQIAPATEPPPWEQPNPTDELPDWLGPQYTAPTPAPAPALVNDGNGTTHVVIEDRAQFEDHIAGILAQQGAPAAPTGQPDLPATGSANRPGNGANGTAKTGNGGSASMASEVTAVFPGLCAKMVADEPYYRNAQGGADMFRILRAAKAEGFAVVNTANMVDVIAKLTERGLRHAQEEAAKAARKQEGTDAGH